MSPFVRRGDIIRFEVDQINFLLFKISVGFLNNCFNFCIFQIVVKSARSFQKVVFRIYKSGSVLLFIIDLYWKMKDKKSCFSLIMWLYINFKGTNTCCLINRLHLWFFFNSNCLWRWCIFCHVCLLFSTGHLLCARF